MPGSLSPAREERSEGRCLPSVQCACASWGMREGPGSSQTPRVISMRVCSARGAVFELFSAGGTRRGGGPDRHVFSEPRPAGCLPSWRGGRSGCFIAHLSFATFFFGSLFLSVEVCTGQHLLLSVVLHQSPSAFALSMQISLGSYKVPPTGHWPWQVPPALCLSRHGTRMSHHGCGWPSSQGNEDQALLSSVFLTFICTNPPPC